MLTRMAAGIMSNIQEKGCIILAGCPHTGGPGNDVVGESSFLLATICADILLQAKKFLYGYTVDIYGYSIVGYLNYISFFIS